MEELAMSLGRRLKGMHEEFYGDGEEFRRLVMEAQRVVEGLLHGRPDFKAREQASERVRSLLERAAEVGRDDDCPFWRALNALDDICVGFDLSVDVMELNGVEMAETPGVLMSVLDKFTERCRLKIADDGDDDDEVEESDLKELTQWTKEAVKKLMEKRTRKLR